MNTPVSPLPRRIQRERAGLLIVDIQERLFPAMSERESLLQNVLRLAGGATALGLPVWVTEQYRKGLGATLPQLTAALPEVQPIDKLTFSAWGAPGLSGALQARGVTELVLCGIEAHVCVAQTGLDLLDAGLRAFLVTDAVTSRTPQNKAAGCERLRDAGAVLVSTEMILFELLMQAGTAEFKQIQALIR